MRILMINPKTSTSVTELIATAARAAASPGTEVVAVTATTGVPYIATRAEAQIGGRAALELLAEHAAGCDAAVIAAFGDPGLGGARELSPIPVVGMAEAAMLTACMLGRRFAIVTFASALAPWFRETVDYHGLAGRLAGIHTLEGRFSGIATVQDEKEHLLIDLAGRAVSESAADVVILAGAPLAGLAARVADRIAVPVVDGVAAALRQAETLAALKPRKATAGTFRKPDLKPSTGLPPALARWISGA
ncbi:MAG: aspartate/glutamate racemase family protein [Alphaproteobacteria bacterium]|nr:aspartate/glutamate racemase family protein [Alphaproteobacteria bacterium]